MYYSHAFHTPLPALHSSVVKDPGMRVLKTVDSDYSCSDGLTTLPTEMRDKLRKWREDNCRNSEQIVDVGEELISEHGSKLGDDSKCIVFFKWLIKNEIRQPV